MRMTTLLLATFLFFIGCSEKLDITQTLLNNTIGEKWSYKYRTYLIFEKNPSVSTQSLINAGYVAVPVAERPLPEFDTYPGRFGVGISKSVTAGVFNKDQAWVIIDRGRLTAEVTGPFPYDFLKELTIINTQQKDGVYKN